LVSDHRGAADEEFIGDPRPERKRELTPREREVLILLVEGRSMREAVKVLNVTPRTVPFINTESWEISVYKVFTIWSMFAIHEGEVPPP